MRSIEINMLAYKLSDDGGLTALELPGDPVHSFGVYVMEYIDGHLEENVELEDYDCATLEEADAKFAEMLAKYPGADENIYSMPHDIGNPDAQSDR